MIKGSFIITLILISVNLIFTKPSFNSSTGCTGGGCHNLSAGILSVSVIGENQIQVNLNGVSSNQDVAGELVNMNGEVVDVQNGTKTNPFILTAPSPGKYLVNAGYKQPNRLWDSSSVDLGITDIGNESPVFVKDHGLLSNYPNPFNSSTVIQFSVEHPSPVRLIVYDISGREIARLIDENIQPGTYKRIFNAENLPSGVYFYQLQTGKIVKTKKLTLIK